MPEEGGIHYKEQQGVVTLTCGGEAFVRLTAAIVTAVGPAVVMPATARMVVVRLAEPPGRPPNPWLDAIGYFGCAAVAVAVIGLLGAGAYTVSSWFW